MVAQIKAAAEKNKHVSSYYKKLGLDLGKIGALGGIPFIPVQMFKLFDLGTCEEKDIVRILNSSSTTGQIPSRIPIDKVTAFRQTKALVSTLANYLGKKRRPFLVLDTEKMNLGDADSITARGAAIRGLSNFANEVCYAMREENGELRLDIKKLMDFQKRHADEEVFAFGFTFIIWNDFVKAMEKEKSKLHFRSIKLLHGGGWKRLASMAVSKAEFDSKVAEIFSTGPESILDFYGMAEQTGTVFVDCEFGFKHVPDFADIIIRDVRTLEENGIGKEGLIEVLSVLPHSYAGHAILTEDIGELKGIDDCKCGRKGKYFVFKSRAERAEVRGCGDTFAESGGYD